MSEKLAAEIKWLRDMEKANKPRDWWVKLLRHYHDPRKQWELPAHEVHRVRSFVEGVVVKGRKRAA